MVKKSTLLLLAAFMIFSVSTGCGRDPSPETTAAGTTPQQEPAAVSGAPAGTPTESGDSSVDGDAPGADTGIGGSSWDYIQPYNQPMVTILTARSHVKVLSRISGMVVGIEKEEGDRVREGDVLARLDDKRYRLEYDKASAEALRTRAIFHRNQEGFQEDARVKIVSELELDVSRAEYMKAWADSALKFMEWEYTRIKAPISGYVIERKIQPGQWIGMQEELFTVADLDELWAVFVVPDALQRSLTDGQSMTLHVNPGEESFTVTGTLLLRSPVVDPSGGVKITVQIINRPGRLELPPGFGSRLRPGMPVELVLR